jgi:type II secretion system protein N
MSLSPRLRLAARIVGYVVLGLVTFVVALHLTFPYERIRDRALESLSTKYDVTIGGVERSWVPGRFSLTAVTLRSRPAVVGQTTTTMYFKRVEIDLAFLPLLSSKVQIGLDISTGNGRIAGTVTQQKAETAIDFRLTRVPMATIPGISDAVGLPMNGNADGKVRLKIAKGDWSKATGLFELACNVGCTVGDGITKIYPKTKRPGDEAWAKDGVPVPPVKIQSFKLAIDLAKGEAKRRTFELKSTDGEADIDFDIKLAKSILDSTITGCIKYKCSKELYERERSFRVQCDFGSPVVDDAGFHHIKLMGKLTNVRRIGALCDGQSDRGDPTTTQVGNGLPRVDLPVAETLHAIDAAAPEMDASVAPPPVEPPVMGRPKDDVPPPGSDGTDGVRQIQQPPIVPPPVVNGGSAAPVEGVRTAPEGGRLAPQQQPEGVSPPNGEKVETPPIQ